MTSNLQWADSPGNVTLTARATGLPRQSVVNVTQLVILDNSDLTERVGKLAPAKLQLILAGMDIIFGR